jgi:hypothetical protein
LWPPRCGGKDRLKFTGLSILLFHSEKVKLFSAFLWENHAVLKELRQISRTVAQ